MVQGGPSKGEETPRRDFVCDRAGVIRTGIAKPIKKSLVSMS